MSLKQKNILLLVGLTFLIWICYKIPVSQTLSAKKEYTMLKQEQSLYSNIAQKVGSFNREKIALDSILSQFQFSADATFQSNLLNAITKFSGENKLDIITFDEPHIFVRNKTSVNSFSFSVRGDYSNTLRLIHELEQVKKLGKVLTINFEKKKNYRINKEFLETKIIVQRFED